MRRRQFADLPQPPGLPRYCSYSHSLQEFVHRFALGRRTCECGECQVDEPPKMHRRWGARPYEAVKRQA